jgi:hypothetical protein
LTPTRSRSHAPLVQQVQPVESMAPIIALLCILFLPLLFVFYLKKVNHRPIDDE